LKTLIPADRVASSLCGTQKLKPGAKLRKSRFCVILSCEDGTLLYHTLTGELRLLMKDENLEQYHQELTDAWFFVPENWDEVRFARQIRSILAAVSMQGKEKTSFVILPTTDCNARCYYCFERGVTPVTMTPETARETAKYIAQNCGGKPVSVHWFGGEPLFNKTAIDIISAGLTEYGVDFHSRMTSNAFYLDEDTVRKAKNNWHLEQVQITLDGTEKIYNRVKAYQDVDKNPYQRVLQNVKFALDAGIRVILRLNMDASNADDLFNLVDEIGGRFHNHVGLSVIVVLLKEFAGKIHCFTSDQEAITRSDYLQKKISNYGLSYEEPMLSGRLAVNKCNADNDAAEVILPDGKIAKCEHINCSGTVGSIFSSERDENEIRSWKEPAHFSECGECALLPRCGVLKRCEWVENGCSMTMRYKSMRILEKQIYRAYQAESTKRR